MKTNILTPVFAVMASTLIATAVATEASYFDLLRDLDQTHDDNSHSTPRERRSFCFGSGATADQRKGCPPATGSGLFVDTSTCTPQQVAYAQKAIVGVGELAMAAQVGMRKDLAEDSPYLQFFGLSVKEVVVDVFQTVVDYTTEESVTSGVDPKGFASRKSASPIRLTCKDEYRVCSRRNAFRKTPSRASAHYIKGTNDIVLCDLFFHFPSDLNPPCTNYYSSNGLTGMGAISQPLILLRELARALRQPVVGDWAIGTSGCLGLQWATDPKNAWKLPEWAKRLSLSRAVPENNADTFARYAAWTRDFGYGSVGTESEKICTEEYWRPTNLPPWTGEEISDPGWINAWWSRFSLNRPTVPTFT